MLLPSVAGSGGHPAGARARTWTSAAGTVPGAPPNPKVTSAGELSRCGPLRNGNGTRCHQAARRKPPVSKPA